MWLLPLVTLAITLAHATISVEAAEFDVTLHLSNGTAVEEDVVYDLGPGDFVECRHSFSSNIPITYGWDKVPPLSDPEGEEADGPMYLAFESEPDTQNNRLHMSDFLGQGEPTGYRCIAADTDTFGQRANLTGAVVYFKFVEDQEPRTIGTTFPEVDRIGREGDEISLTCMRERAIEGRVLIETYNQIGLPNAVIYDSDDYTNGLAEGYRFDNIPEEDWTEHPEDYTNFTFSVIMAEERATFHRCTIQDGGLQIHSQVMLFLVDYVDGDDCTTQGYDPDNGNNAGDIISFGCHVTPFVHSTAGLTHQITVNTYWQMTSDGSSYSEVEGSQVLDGESVAEVTTETSNEGSSYVCTAEFHREIGTATRGLIVNACSGNGYSIDVVDGSVSMRLYYGEESMEDIVEGSTLVTDKVTNADIICVVYNNGPNNPPGETVEIEVQKEEDGPWHGTENTTIPYDDILEGRQYRCRRTLDGAEDILSEEIHIIQRIIQTEIYNSAGVLLGDTFFDTYDINIGDYLECRAAEPEKLSDLYPPKFAWQRSIQANNPVGPYQLTYGVNYTENGPVTRMYIDYEMGRGELQSYQCIGTDDLRGLQLNIAGTVVRFTAVELPAGILFDEGDYAVEVNETVNLSCIRASGSVRVIWDTVDLDGEVVTELYDSDPDNGKELPGEGYEFLDENPQESNNYTLRITVSETTAIFTRCTLTPPPNSRQYNEVSQTAMIFAIDQVEECFITDEETIDVGEEVRFRGCDASIVVSDQSGVVDADYQAIMHWAVSPEGSDEFTIIEESRVFDAESIHEETALTEVDGNSYQCGIQISRPNAITNSATIANLCDVGVTLEVTDNSVNFRIYYGDVGEENLIQLGRYTTYVGNENNKDMTCQIDRHPSPISGATIRMQTRANPNDDWENTNSDTVLADDIITGHQYRCQYFDGSNNRESSTISMVDGINDIHGVEIVDSSGTILSEDEVYQVVAGDYVTCRPTNGSVYRPQYMWTQMLFGEQVPGPQVIQNPSDDIGHNRFYFSMALGEGQQTGYNCIAADNIADLPGGLPIDSLGRKLRFQVSAGSNEPAGIPPPDEDHAALAEAQVSLHCSKSTDESHLIWETVPATGDPVLIYDSTEDVETPPGYAIQQEGQDFILVVTVSNVTALITRCSVSEEGKATVTGSAMIFLIEPTDCIVSGHEDTNGLGDTIHFSGCGGQTITADNSGITLDHFDAVAYWQQATSGTEEFSIVEESKVLSEGTTQSQYHLMVDGEDHDTTLRCGIQVKRPDTASSAGSVDHLCEADYAITVADGDLYFQMHYGESPVIFQDDSNQDELITLGFVDGNEIMCEADAFPENDESEVTVHEMLNGEAWVPHEDSAIEGSVNATYRCAYTVGETTTVSASVKLVTAINTVPELGIYRSNSDQLIAEDTIITVDAGDYLVCRPLDNEVVEPGLYYIWEKQRDVSGPRMLHYENEMDGSNRLLVNSDLGAGSATEYICQAAVGDQLEPPAEDVGRRVQFRVEFSTGSADSPHVTVAALLITLLAVFYNY